MVVLGALVSPGHGAVAVVGEVLAGLDAQETQETQLYHTHRLAGGVHIGELGGGGGFRVLSERQENNVEENVEKQNMGINIKGNLQLAPVSENTTDLTASGKLAVP